MEEEESIEERHRRERKELQAKIQTLKHSVSKGDKKRKKQINLDIAKLEAELDERQTEELKEGSAALRIAIENITQQLESTKVSAEITDDKNDDTQPKLSKAQKRREKKEADERARQKRLEEGEKEAAFHSRNIEASLFADLLKEKGLIISEVNPDGDCMYQSILLQMDDSDKISLSELRSKTCDYLLQHLDHFIPFTSNTVTGDTFTSDEYISYCHDIKQTNAWGGQVELQAISQLFQQPIEVYQASVPTLCIGEEYQKAPFRLSYHRHQYGLGEHYNALLPDVQNGSL